MRRKKKFQTGNSGERKIVQSKLRDEIRKAKYDYKEKVEAKFQYDSMLDAWCALKDLSGQCRPQYTAATSLSNQECLDFSNSLNKFYCSFECKDLRLYHDPWTPVK